MAKWTGHGAVFVSGGRRTKGVVYLSDTAPKKRVVKGKKKKGSVASVNRRRRKHGRR